MGLRKVSSSEMRHGKVLTKWRPSAAGLNAPKRNPVVLRNIALAHAGHKLKHVNSSLSVVQVFQILDFWSTLKEFSVAGILEEATRPLQKPKATQLLRELVYGFTHLKWLRNTGSLLVKMKAVPKRQPVVFDWLAWTHDVVTYLEPKIKEGGRSVRLISDVPHLLANTDPIVAAAIPTAQLLAMAAAHAAPNTTIQMRMTGKSTPSGFNLEFDYVGREVPRKILGAFDTALRLGTPGGGAILPARIRALPDSRILTLALPPAKTA